MLDHGELPGRLDGGRLWAWREDEEAVPWMRSALRRGTGRKAVFAG